MNKILYYIFYTVMLIGYAGLSFGASDIRSRAIGIILLIANALIFWK